MRGLIKTKISSILKITVSCRPFYKLFAVYSFYHLTFLSLVASKHKEDNMCGSPEAKSKQSTTKAHWHLSWNATSPPPGSGKPMLHCMQAPICAPSQVPQDKGLYYTSRFSHISSTSSHYNCTVDQTLFIHLIYGSQALWTGLFYTEGITLLYLILSLIYIATVMTDEGQKLLPHTLGSEE